MFVHELLMFKDAKQERCRWLEPAGQTENVFVAWIRQTEKEHSDWFAAGVSGHTLAQKHFKDQLGSSPLIWSTSVRY